MASEPTSQRDPPAVAEFVEQLAGMLFDLGMPLMGSRVFAALLTTDDGRLTAAELSEQLEVSPAAISGAVRYLIPLNLIARRRLPGSRRDHYFIQNDNWYEMAMERDQVLRRLCEQFEVGIAAVGRETPAGARLKETLEFFEFFAQELPAMFERWRSTRTGH